MSNPYDPPAGDPTPPPLPAYGQPPAYGEPQYGQPQYGQPQYGQPAQYYGGYPVPARRNGLGTAALVLGIVGTVAGAVVVFFYLAFVLGVLAVVFGLIGCSRARRGEATNKKAATWGFALGVVALVLSVVGGILIFHVAKDQRDCRARAVTREQYDACSHKL